MLLLTIQYFCLWCSLIHNWIHIFITYVFVHLYLYIINHIIITYICLDLTGSGQKHEVKIHFTFVVNVTIGLQKEDKNIIHNFLQPYSLDVKQCLLLQSHHCTALTDLTGFFFLLQTFLMISQKNSIVDVWKGCTYARVIQKVRHSKNGIC